MFFSAKKNKQKDPWLDIQAQLGALDCPRL